MVDGSSSSSGGTTEPGTSTATGSTGDSTGDETTGGEMSECTDPATAMYPGTVRDLDIVLVVDNSGTMGLAQARLGGAMDAFVARLDNEGIDYRIAVTTTDAGNPWCAGNGPEAGRFVSSSCRQRTQDFVFQGAVQIDVTNEACLDICPHETIPLTPTSTDLDPNPVSRPWIERINGTTNLPAGVTPAEALRCIVPQGISGCGFERTLESMRLALLRAVSDTEENYGFMRPDTDLLVVLVTDEVDCSHDPTWETIFLPDGNRVFWSDPAAASPTSAVCWNAGVACTGGPGVYAECHAENYDVDANVTAPGNAVLFPLSRYTDHLAGIDANNGAGAVRFALIGGVPTDYPNGGDLVYEDAMDPMFQNNFGIGAGCSGPDVEALPPVRIREVAEAYADPGERNIYSLCEPALCNNFEAIIDDVVQ